MRPLLEAKGHEVFTPTLTGVGERSHLLGPGTRLETHITDIVNAIRWEELSDIVPSPFQGIAQRLRQDPTWQVLTMPCGHEVMVDMPRELADALTAAA